MTFQISPPASEAEFEAYYELRWRILRAPWGQPRGSERDEHEAQASHACVYDAAGRLIGVGRLHLNSPEEGQIRYMAVAPGWQGQGVGRQIVAYLEEQARARGAVRVILNARERIAGFYQRLGYQVLGQGPTLFGEIKHVRMGKDVRHLSIRNPQEVTIMGKETIQQRRA